MRSPSAIVALTVAVLSLVAHTTTAIDLRSEAEQLSVSSNIPRRILRKLQVEGRADIVVALKEARSARLLQTRAKPKDCDSGFDSDWSARTNSASRPSDEAVQEMVDNLETHAQTVHAEVMGFLASQASSGSSSSNTSEPAYATASSLWISNEIVIRGATAELLAQVTSLPSVGSIREEVIAHIPLTEIELLDEVDDDFGDRRRRRGEELVGEWGVERVQALEAWKIGLFGNGSRVATIDSGVRATHSILQGSFFGEYGWLDALSGSTTPQDSSGHGTGVMGVITGASGIGVAPEAKWMACRACDAGNDCKEGDLLECAQFMACPYTTTSSTSSGTSQQTKNCAARPHVINNSWTLDRGTTSFQAVIDVWVAAGIVPVFSAGNEGPTCATVAALADSDTKSITVGSTGYTDALSSFSARGPGQDGRVKPDVVAPGETIVSSGYESDSSLKLYSGTSLSAPHVAGVAALLIEQYPELTVDTIVSLIQQGASTAVTLPTGANAVCAVDSKTTTTTTATVPNNAFGYGLANLASSMKLQSAK